MKKENHNKVSQEENIVEDGTNDNRLNVNVKKNNLFFSILGTANCVIGSGIVALPYASHKCGLPLAMMLAILSCLISAHSCTLLVVAAKKTHSKSYVEVVEKSLGKIAKYILILCHFLFPAFISIAYGIAISDNITLVFEYLAPNVLILQNRLFILYMILIFIIIPLSLPKYLAILNKASATSIAFVVFYTIVFAIKTPPMNQKILVLPEMWNLTSTGVASSFGTLFFAFTIQQNIIFINNSLSRNTLTRSQTSIFSAMSLSVVVYFICMVAGFVSYPLVIRSNILNNYCVNDNLILATRIIFSITLILTYPFPVHSAKDIILDYINLVYKVNRWIRYATTVVLIIIFGGLTAFSASIGPVIEIGGSLTASPLILIFPPLVYIKLFSKSFLTISLRNISLWLLALFGLVIMVFGTIMSALDAISVGELLIEKYWCI